MARMKEDELGLNHLTTALSAWPYVISDNEALLRCKQQRIHNALLDEVFHNEKQDYSKTSFPFEKSGLRRLLF